jgi:hypothetical protein
MIGRRRRPGWGSQHDDRSLRLAMVTGAILGIPLGLLTANLGWIAGRLVDLSQVLGR